RSRLEINRGQRDDRRGYRPSPPHFSATQKWLEDVGEPRQNRVEGVWIKQEVRHPGKRYEYEQCVDAVPDGFPSLGHGTEYCRIGSARKFSSSTFSLRLPCMRTKEVP